MTDQHGQSVEEKVMQQIVTGRVKLRSRYIFLAEKVGLGSAVSLSILLAVLLASLLLFYLQATDNLSYLSFGQAGLYAWLESFPYVLVIVFTLSVFVAGWLLKRTGTLYQKSFRYVALGLVGFVLVAGAALAFTFVGETVENEAYGPQMFGAMFHSLLAPGLDERRRGAAGLIVSSTPGQLIIQTPRGERTIDISAISPLTFDVQPGVFVVAIGERHDDVFVAAAVRVVNPSEMPMVRRGVHRRFGSFVPSFHR